VFCAPLESTAPAAVDFDRLAGDVGGEGGAEEEDGVGDFLGGAEAAEGHVLEHLGAHVFGDGGGHGGVDDTGGDGVDADLAAGGFAAEDAHHGLNSGFSGGIIGLAKEALDRSDTPEADDGTMVAEDFEGVFAAVEDAVEVDGGDGIPFIKTHFGDGAVLDDGGVVDQNIEAAAFALDFGHHGLDFLRLRDISGDDVSTVRAELIQVIRNGLGIDSGVEESGMIQYNGGTRLVKSAGYLSADALRGAGDEGNFAGEVDGNHGECSVVS